MSTPNETPATPTDAVEMTALTKKSLMIRVTRELFIPGLTLTGLGTKMRDSYRDYEKVQMQKAVEKAPD